MKDYCAICYEQSNRTLFNYNVIGICEETHKPVCNKCARYCQEDGHGVIPLTPSQGE